MTRVVKLDSFEQFGPKTGVQAAYLEPLPNLQEVSVQGFECLFGVDSEPNPWSISVFNEVPDVEKDNVGFGDDRHPKAEVFLLELADFFLVTRLQSLREAALNYSPKAVKGTKELDQVPWDSPCQLIQRLLFQEVATVISSELPSMVCSLCQVQRLDPVPGSLPLFQKSLEQEGDDAKD